MNRYITELVGTFFLVLAIGLSVIGGSPLAALAIGGMLVAVVFMGGHVSGAHYNPAVSLAVCLRGKISPKDMVIYWIVQIIGALAAAVVARWVIMGKGIEASVIPANKLVAALTVEFLFTFILALVILNVATAKGTSGNSFYGLAIGITVMAGAIAGGGISGGAFNPAVGIAVTVMGVPVQNLWLYFVGPLAGGAAAALVFKVQNPEG
ncbi:MAG: porin [Phycisphaerales bacterium]|nr:porin [Phycisphaerales bacterium]